MKKWYIFWFVLGYLSSSGIRGCTTALQQAVIETQVQREYQELVENR